MRHTAATTAKLVGSSSGSCLHSYYSKHFGVSIGSEYHSAALDCLVS